jgi:hypothetical protein
MKSVEGEDLLWGADAITRFVNELSATKRTRKQVYNLIAKKHLPARHIGSQLLASKKKIRDHLEGLLDGAIAQREPRAPAPLSRPRRTDRARRAR